MALLAAIPDISTLLLGMDWMEPDWLLDRFGAELLWVSLVIIFVECGLFFPFLPGDTLLFALGLFIATERLDVFPGGHLAELVADRAAPADRRGVRSATSPATRSAGPSGRRSTTATAGS